MRLADAIDWLLGSPTSAPKRRGTTRRAAAVAKKKTPRKTHAPRAAVSKTPTASPDPRVRIRALAAKGAHRTEAEDREFASLIERTRRNPGKYRNPSDTNDLARAKRLSVGFHGEPHEVYELSPAERRGLPRYVVGVGSLEAVEYRPDRHSQRKGTYRHESGDTGGFTRKKGRSLLVVDPRTMRPAIVANRSGQRFSSAKGLIG